MLTRAAPRGTAIRMQAGPLHAPGPRIVRRAEAGCGTVKLGVELIDGALIESVIIPNKRRTTVCVSTQFGCGRGCMFCATATMGLRRSLTAEEIVAQVHIAIGEAQHRELPALRNVVFMGMGEPFDNLGEVGRAVAHLTDPRGLAIAPRHITVSTVGTSPRAIRRAVKLPARLAWSLHAADERLHHRLVPTRRHPLVDLRDAFAEIMHVRNDILYVEVVLIAGINDTEADAAALAALLRPLHPKVRFNLLPANPARGARPTPEPGVVMFRQVLRQWGYFCNIRRPRGLGANAACGQLVTLARAGRGP